MIDVLVGSFIAGACIGWLVADIRHHLLQTSGADAPDASTPPVSASTETSPPAPEPLALYSDTHWQPEDLKALRLLLANTLPLDVAQARYDDVLAQIAADETHDGIDAIEDAANQRRTT